jgi:hypothetical protein
MSVMKSKARANIEMTLAEKVAAVATARQKNINAIKGEEHQGRRNGVAAGGPSLFQLHSLDCSTK